MNDAQRIADVFNGRLLAVPDYQRGYAWEKRQWDEFLQDVELLELGKEHYTGTLVLHAIENETRKDEEGNKYDAFHIVDGQQRLITIVILLDAIRREIASQRQKLADGIKKNYICVPDLGSIQQIYRLQLFDDHEFFIQSVLSDNPGPAGAKNYAQRQLTGAKKYFRDYLKENRQGVGEADYQEWLLELYEKITQQLKVSLYLVEETFDVGVIFEVMNNRGKPLSELEKVKNYLLYLASKLDKGAGRELADKVNWVWKKIFENLMIAELAGTSKEDQLLKAHWIIDQNPERRNWEGSKSVKVKFDLKSYLGNEKNLYGNLHNYVTTLDRASLAYCEIEKPNSERTFSLLENDHSLRQKIIDTGEKLQRIGSGSAFLPVLMATRLRYPEDGKKYLDMINMCEIFSFRVSTLLGKRTDAGEVKLARIGHELHNGGINFEEALAEVREELLRHCPTYQFQSSFRADEQQDWYEWSGIRYFLYEYEEHLANKERSEIKIPWERINEGKLENSIEHILPQTPDHTYWTSRFDEDQRKIWTNDIGNLSLTYFNPKLGNKPFPQKKGSLEEDKCYSASQLLIERELARLNDWNVAELEKRREAIVSWALNRWCVDESELASINSGEE